MHLDFDEVKGMLSVEKSHLDDELEMQPVIMQEISEIVADLSHRAEEAKNDLKKIEAGIWIEGRQSPIKMSNDDIQAVIQESTRRDQAFKKYLDAKREHERWMGLLDAWRNRGYTLNTLAELYKASYFSRNSDDTGSGRYQHAREVLSNHRRQNESSPQRRVRVRAE